MKTTVRGIYGAWLTGVLLTTLTACGGGGSNATYTVGGTVSGLTGSGLVLRDNGNDDLPISASGAFQFAIQVVNGAAYAVTVSIQPTNPAQTCAVINGNGTMGNSNITNVAVSCAATVKGTFIGVNYINSGDEGGFGTTIFDGSGGISGTSVGNRAGNIGPVESESGTYTVSAGGAMTLGSNVGGVSADGSIMVFEDTVMGELAYIDIEIKQGQKNFTNTDLNGTYEVVTSGSSGDSGTLWTLIADGAGNFSASAVQNNAGTVSPSSAITGTYTVAPDGGLTVNPTGAPSLTGGVGADGSTLVLSELTAGQAPSMTVGIKQGQSNFTNADVSGTYLIATYESSGDSGALLTITFDGAGNFDGTSTRNDSGFISDQTVTGTYSVAAGGRLTWSPTGRTGLTGGVSADGNRLVLTSLNPGDPPDIGFGIRQ